MTPTGQLIACAGAERILLWDLRDSEPKGKLVIRTNTREQYSVAFAADGKMLASGGLDGIWLWTDLDMNPPKQRAHMRVHRATALGFAPDGKPSPHDTAALPAAADGRTKLQGG